MNDDIIIQHFNSGKTHAEIGDIVGLPRRSVMKICQKLGLKRTRKEAASLKIKSSLDEPDTIAKISELVKTVTAEDIAAMFGTSKSSVLRLIKKHDLSNEEYAKNKRIASMQNAWTDEKRRLASVRNKELMTQEIRQKISNNSYKNWEKQEYIEKQAAARFRNKLNNPVNGKRRKKDNGPIEVNAIQCLHNILDNLGVRYSKEPINIDQFTFDCAIFIGNKTLVIGIGKDNQDENGIIHNRWHYADRILNNKYEFKLLWERDFTVVNKVENLLSIWLGHHHNNIEQFNKSELIFSEVKRSDVDELFDNYHYLGSIRSAKNSFGLFLNGVVIAACVFSYPSRKPRDFGYGDDAVVELSRLCIHPNYQQKNLASWFVSRCLKKLPRHVRVVISFSDETYNHKGITYKAANFEFDGFTDPSYWYADNNGRIVAHRHVQRQAIKSKISESEYAESSGLVKILGLRKRRYLYFR